MPTVRRGQAEPRNSLHAQGEMLVKPLPRIWGMCKTSLRIDLTALLEASGSQQEQGKWGHTRGCFGSRGEILVVPRLEVTADI